MQVYKSGRDRKTDDVSRALSTIIERPFTRGGEGPGQRKGIANGRGREEGEGGSDGMVWAWLALGLASSPPQAPTKAWTLGAGRTPERAA
ncbi:hypothetical protein GGTG_08234 [Gaeumannomyces tritici R3-111a-1]|uniref:Uncharacterized protein n=1 Tax=Gaeumannomyces tritici (strain R3-111a-1) TaxID=644352 RepID=J3P3Z9_GAET3|nr:hypothetical protein GGTG_08234 [Gaeumannomyces tritici R3-111a-1]EJT74393.1 hypothetical protein GGTG_08234 [Gaeumannomyces tritici R3-111a-1]